MSVTTKSIIAVGAAAFLALAGAVSTADAGRGGGKGGGFKGGGIHMGGGAKFKGGGGSMGKFHGYSAGKSFRYGGGGPAAPNSRAMATASSTLMAGKGPASTATSAGSVIIPGMVSRSTLTAAADAAGSIARLWRPAATIGGTATTSAPGRTTNADAQFVLAPAWAWRGYCGKPSTAKIRKVAYFSPIFRSSLYCGESRHAWI